MPSSFIDIMMLRPAVRTSEMPACSFAIEHLDHAAPFGAAVVEGEAEIADEFAEPLQPAQIFVPVLLGELDKQNRLRIAAQERIDDRPVHGDVAGKPEHGAVDQLDRDRPERDDVLRRFHRFVEAAEMAGAERAAAKQRRQFQLDPGREGERALGADEQMREIDVVPCPAPAHRDCSRRRAAALSESAARSRRPRARRWRAGRASMRCGTLTEGSPSRPKCARVPSASMASIAITFSRVLP